MFELGRSGRLWAPLFLCTAASVSAEDFKLALPVACTLGEDCYIQQYFDRDPSEGAVQDFACGVLANDGHGGTDFAVPTLADMAAGLPVIAAAPGRVVATRDGMPDISSLSPDAPDLQGKDCGNGVLVDHGDGWQTQYCHLRNGSVAVRKGAAVETGTPLGLVGMSGRASFPHMHFTLRKDGEKVDPFAVEGGQTCPADPAQGVWQAPPTYVAAGLLEAGFADRLPALEDLRAGLPSPAVTPTMSPALVVWFYAFGGLEGDEIEIVFDGPKGEIGRTNQALPKDQPFFMYGYGKRVPVQGWPWGTYRGTVVLRRDGEEYARQVVETKVD